MKALDTTVDVELVGDEVKKQMSELELALVGGGMGDIVPI